MRRRGVVPFWLLLAQGFALALSLGPALAALLGAASTPDPLAALSTGARAFPAILGASLVAAVLGGLVQLLAGAGAAASLAAELTEQPPDTRASFGAAALEGAGRLFVAGALSTAVVVELSLLLAGLAWVGSALWMLQPGLVAAAALAVAMAATPLVLFADAWARLVVVRASLGDGPVDAVANAGGLLGRRAGALLLLTLAVALVELLLGLTFASFSGLLSAGPLVLSLGPRLALSLVGAVVVAYVDAGRWGALAALALDDVGLLPRPEPAPPPTAPPPLAEPIVDALPIAE